jgi:1-acyl-sn-glycerol-3-phosphate acyltransferase
VLPPRWVRRVLLAPAIVALTLLVLLGIPLWLLAAAVASPFLPGRWRALRVLLVVVVHLVLESVGLVVLFVLWVASGFGWKLRTPRFQRAHYRIVEWYLQSIYYVVRHALRVTVRVEGPAPAAYTARPLLVFCRHAGPGDSFLLAHALVNWYDREPRIVLKDTLQWDPAIDVLLNRLPTTFLRPGKPDEAGPTVEERIARLATALDGDDAFVIFPEGGNFTPARRERAIARLNHLGLHRMAARADRMIHVLAPRPGGVVAALGAAPEADVVWVAHTGVDDLLTVLDVWRALPMDKTIEMRWWQVPADQVPREREDQIEWLFHWWGRIDAWIEERKLVADPWRTGEL